LAYAVFGIGHSVALWRHSNGAEPQPPRPRWTRCSTFSNAVSHPIIA